ncbi:hypothetical protein HY522_00175 [bacterium]|nr:hypothetical protein [bacterium]
MDSAARGLLLAVLCSLILGMFVVLTNRDYRPAEIYETNRRAFSHVPVESEEDMSPQ